jgi:YVTN family beta-propeller protein
VTRGPRPSLLAGYRVERLLGRGGMGEVYLAEDLRLKRKVALKVLSAPFATQANATFRERFLTESELAASIDHPNIVPIYEAGDADGNLFIAMRYVEGTDLRTRLREGPLQPVDAIDLLTQVASALDLAHARGLVHRDVKPSNILVASGAGHEGVDHAYLADFGLTKRVSEEGSLSEDGQLMGTVDYVAPEQITGDAIDGRADIYSLGCLLFECLAGDPPFRRDSDIAVLFAHLEEAPPVLTERRPDLPAAIDPVIARALAKKPDARYQLCQDLVTDARDALGIARPAPLRRRRWPALVGAAALGLLAWLVLGLVGGTEIPTDTLLRIDPTSNEVVDAVDVGDRASSVAVGDGYLWVTSMAGRSLWRIDPQTGETRATPVDGTPMDVAIDNGLAVVVTGPYEASAERIDAASGALNETIPLPGAEGASTAVASGPGGIWVAGCGYGGGNVGRVSEANTVGGFSAIDDVDIFSENPNWVFGHTPDFPAYTDIAVGEGAVWLTLDSGPALRRVDPLGREPVEVIDLPFLPKSLTTGAGSVWITSLVTDEVARLDPKEEVVTMTVPVGRGADGIAFGLGDVWVADSIDGTVTRLDADTGEVLATIPVDGQPEDVVVGPGGVWVTTHTS